MNSNQKKPRQCKGPWSHRFAIKFFSIILTILIFWLLGFLVEDIRTIKGPKLGKIEIKYLDKSLIENKKKLKKEINETERLLKRKKNKQNILKNSTSNLQRTINQLLELQRLSIQKNVKFSEKEQTAFASSLSHFLNNQKNFQLINEEIANQTEIINQLQDRKQKIENKLEQQRIPAQREFKKLRKSHEYKLAFFQLSILIPLMIIAALLIIKLNQSIYSTMFYGFGISTLLKVSLVIHEYFPSKLFKYIFILFSITAVIKILIYFIRSIAFPKAQALIKQYIEAYTNFLCPVCEFPIRRGPMKFLFWNRKTIKKMPLNTSNSSENEPYVCPSCGIDLFNKCDSCNSIRYSLLPNCNHCGSEKNIENI